MAFKAVIAALLFAALSGCAVTTITVTNYQYGDVKFTSSSIQEGTK